MQIKNINNHWYAPLISGIIFIGAGILALVYQKETFKILAFLFSLSFLLSGVLEIVYSLINRKTLTQWGWLFVSGILSLIFGILLWVNPFLSIITLALFVGFSFLFRSVGGIVLSINMKKVQNPKWKSLLALSLLGVLFSFALILDPMFMWVAIILLTAITFIAAGIFSVCLSIYLKKMNRLIE